MGDDILSPDEADQLQQAYHEGRVRWMREIGVLPTEPEFG